MTSNISSVTVHVPSGDGYEQPAETGVRGSIAEKMRRLPKVDANGRTVATQAETNVVDVVPGAQPGQTPRMADALMAAAAAVGADVTSLVDSASFTRTLGSISPADTAGLVSAIQNAVAQNPALALQPAAPGMRPNPAQGASGGAVPSRPKTVEEMVRAQAAKAAGQPLPPGSTTTY